MSIGIYKITSPNGKIYIGQSINIEKRWKYGYYNITVCKSQIKLYRSLLKYGYENHIFEIVELCDIKILNEREIHWGLFYKVLENNGLNLKLGNRNGKHSEETKQKISKARKGWKPSIERGIKIGNKNRNRILSKEHKDKIGQANVNKSKPYKGRISPNKGKKHIKSEIQKLNMLNSHGKSILQYDLNMNFIKEWKTLSEITKELNIRSGSISQCASGKIKKSHGFIWKYK